VYGLAEAISTQIVCKATYTWLVLQSMNILIYIVDREISAYCKYTQNTFVLLKSAFVAIASSRALYFFMD